MIGKIKHMKGSASGPIIYILGGKREKDQIVSVVAYNGFALSRKMIEEIEFVPKNNEERKEHKRLLRKFGTQIASVFDTRASLADYRVEKPNEHHILGFSPEDDDILTPELREIIVMEFLQGMGLHGEIEVTRRRKSGKVKEKLHREVIFLACSHSGTNAPHVHVFVCRVDENGKVNSTHYEYLRALRVCRQISKKYGLHLRLNGKEVTAENGYTLCQKDYTPDYSNSNSDYARKNLMKAIVKRCLADAKSLDQFIEALGKEHIAVTLHTYSDSGETYGISYSMPYKGKKRKLLYCKVKGSKLDSSLSYPKIISRLSQNVKNEKNSHKISVERKSSIIERSHLQDIVEDTASNKVHLEGLVLDCKVTEGDAARKAAISLVTATRNVVDGENVFTDKMIHHVKMVAAKNSNLGKRMDTLSPGTALAFDGEIAMSSDKMLFIHAYPETVTFPDAPSRKCNRAFLQGKVINTAVNRVYASANLLLESELGDVTIPMTVHKPDNEKGWEQIRNGELRKGDVISVRGPLVSKTVIDDNKKVYRLTVRGNKFEKVEKNEKIEAAADPQSKVVNKTSVVRVKPWLKR